MECGIQNKCQPDDGNSEQINNFNKSNSKMLKCAIFDSQIEQSHLHTSATDFRFSGFSYAPITVHCTLYIVHQTLSNNNNSHDCIVHPIISSHQLPAIVYPYCNKITSNGNDIEKKILFKKRREKNG